MSGANAHAPLRVLGLDLSLTATGVAWPDGELSTLTPTALPKNATDRHHA